MKIYQLYINGRWLCVEKDSYENIKVPKRWRWRWGIVVKWHYEGRKEHD